MKIHNWVVYVFVIGVFPAPKERLQGLKWRNSASTEIVLSVWNTPNRLGACGRGVWMGSPPPSLRFWATYICVILAMVDPVLNQYFSSFRKPFWTRLGFKINTKLCIEYRAYSKTDFHVYILNKNKFKDKFATHETV